MNFPDAFLEDLAARTDIIDFISRYVNLQRRGNAYVGLCPFHSEKTPSFQVTPEKQLYHCFGCGVGGSVFQFTMAIENIDFGEAVHLLADRAGVSVPDNDQNGQAERLLRERLFALHVSAARFFVATLPTNQQAIAYLQRRGLSPKIVRHFGIGATPQGDVSLLSAMQAEGFTKQELLAGGLLGQNDKGEVYDRFRNRLMFPIINVTKKVIGFGGRILGDGQPKYMNSPDTPIFSKSRHLFALNYAKNSKQKGLLLAEGYMDVVSLHQAGFDHAVASLGTSLTELQVQLLQKYTDEVTIAYDTDQAGRKASERATLLLQKAGIKVSMLSLDGAKDPDEYIQRFGAAALDSQLQARENHMDYRIGRLTQAYDLEQDQGKVGFLKEAAALLATVPSEVERDVYQRRVAQLAGIGADAVVLEVKRIRAKAFKNAHQKEEQQIRNPARALTPPGVHMQQLALARAEEELIAMVLFDPEHMTWLSPLLQPDTFATPFLGRIWEQIVLRYQMGAAVSLPALSQVLSPEEIAHLTRVLGRPMSRALTKQAIQDCLDCITREAAARVATQEGEDPTLARALQNIERKKNFLE